jgi:hypothetical protein
VLSKVAVNAELLSQKVTLAGNALNNTNSITEEFNKKNSTLGAELEKLSKRMGALFTNSALSDGIRKFIISLNGIVAPTKSAVQQFDELDKKVKSLDQDITPLANRYDVLSAQTKLSTAEQAEMKSIVEQVAATIPSAITQVDAYGNAIAISTSRVREYIATEKDRLKVVNESAIRETEKVIAATNKQFDALDKRVQERNAKGFFGVEVRAEDGTTFTRKANEQELRELDENYKNVISKRNGLNAELKRLNGEALQENLDASEKERLAREKALEEERKRQAINFGTKDKEDPRIKLLAELKQLQNEVELLGKSADEKELTRIVQKYEKLITEAKAYADIVIELEKLRNKEVSNLIDEVTKKQVEEKKKEEEAEKQKTLKLREELMKRKENELNVARADGANELDRRNRSELATVKINLINSPAGQARLQAQLELLEVERDQELQNVKLTEEEKELIRAEYRAKAAELEIEFYTQQVQQILNYTQQVLSIVDQFYQFQSNKENARLQKELKGNDQKRNAYKRLLDARVISEAEYRRRLAALDEQEDRRKKELELKQFKRAKASQIAQALISGALAVVSTLAARPGATDIISLGAFRAINIALAVAATAASVATIASQKPPEFAKGGIAKGPRHKDNGIKMIDGQTGRQVGEMEGGEPYMILSRNTLSNNGDVISELLDASMNRGGARIRPLWKNRAYESMNFSRANTALRKRYFETGGVMNTSVTDVATAADSGTAETLAEMKEVMMYMANTVNRLSNTLENGIEASVSLRKFKDAETLDQQITDDSTFRP